MARRGFRVAGEAMRERIEQIGGVFSDGYHSALQTSRLEELVARLESVELDFRGFAYEGAAMGLALLDALTPWRRNRLSEFLHGAGGPHTYMVHVAIGWVVARWPGRIETKLAPLDPLLRWLVLDGYGFHEGFFHWPKYVGGQPLPKRLTHCTDALPYAARVFDQGLGRSLWFVDGADPERLKQTVADFPESRQSDLWSGIGLACVYAGEMTESALTLLRDAAGAYWPQLAQGAAFAAKARCRAGNPTAYTERACRSICGLSAEEAAAVTDAALENLGSSQPEPAFEIWRRRIQERFAEGKELAR